jgi:predicted enzyme related to lactoylglutathione lyase
MIKKISTVGVYVDDQDTALKFWTEKVGFELRNKKEMGDGLYWLEVAPVNAESALVLYPKKLMTNYAELKPSIVFISEDIGQTCAQLQKNGVVFTMELMTTAWGKFAKFKDEDGNEFGLKG